MKWSIQQLKKLQHKGLQIDETVDVSAVMERNQEIIHTSPAHVRGTMHYEPESITFHLHITGELTLPCSRTLVDTLLPIDIETDIVFYREEREVDDTEREYHFLQTDTIDLLPIVEDNILADVPIRIVSDQPVPKEMLQGNDWQVVEKVESVEEEKMDPRMADLAKFFDKEKK